MNGVKRWLPYFFFPVGLTLFVWKSPFLISHHFYFQEFLFFKPLFQAIRLSFESFNLPLWNPFLGPGGMPGAAMAIIPWDYHILTKALTPNTLFRIDTSLIFFGLILSLRFMQFPNRVVLIGFPLLAFCYLNLSFVRYLLPFGFLTGLFGTLPLVCGYIFKIARDESYTRTKFIVLTLLFFASFIATKFEMWIQFFLFASLWSAVILIVFPTNRRLFIATTLGAYLTAALLNAWQFYWIGTLVIESRRVRGATDPLLSIVFNFIRSFEKSSPLWLFVVLLFLGWGIRYAFVTQHKWLRSCAVISLSLIVVSLGLIDRNDFIGGNLYTFYLITIVTSAVGLLYVAARGPWIRTFNVALLTALLSHFVFENEAVFNWGRADILDWTPFSLIVFLILTFTSLFTKREKMLKAILFSLTGLYFFRAHLSLLLMQTIGYVWHIQRDGYFFSLCFGWLLVIGLEVILDSCLHRFQRFQTRQLAPIGLYVLTSAAVLVWIFAHRPTFFSTSVWHPTDVKPAEVHALTTLQSLGISSQTALTASIPSELTMPGSLLLSLTRQIDVYDSLISASTRTFFSFATESGLEVQPGRCSFPFIFFPNNIQKVLDCPIQDRLRTYRPQFTLSLGRPKLDVAEFLGLRTVVTLEPQNDFSYSLIHEEKDRTSGPAFYVYRKEPRSASTPFVYHSAKECSKSSLRDWQRVEQIESNLYSEPQLKREFYFRFHNPVPKSGCLLLPVATSKLWSVSQSAQPVEFKSWNGLMAFDLPSVRNQHLQLTYFADFEMVIVLGLLLAFLVARYLIFPLLSQAYGKFSELYR